MKQLFNAFDFSQLISLSRFDQILTFHYNGLIDWTLTWALFRFSNTVSRSHTSFEHSNLISFRTKIMLDELPLLPRLQERKPHIYTTAGNWSCILCHAAPETWEHLCSCPALPFLMESIVLQVKLSLTTSILASPRSASFLLLQSTVACTSLLDFT